MFSVARNVCFQSRLIELGWETRSACLINKKICKNCPNGDHRTELTFEHAQKKCKQIESSGLKVCIGDVSCKSDRDCEVFSGIDFDPLFFSNHQSVIKTNFRSTFSGPVASLFNERFSTRTTMFIGGILSAIGLVISAFATDFFIILLSFGILTGKIAFSRWFALDRELSFTYYMSVIL